MSNDHRSTPLAPDAERTPDYGRPVIVGSGVWFGFCRFRIEEVPAFRAYYLLPWRRLGIVFKVALDGTPWAIKGRKYLVNCERDFWRAALGKYAIGILKRSLPNTEISHANPNTNPATSGQ